MSKLEEYQQQETVVKIGEDRPSKKDQNQRRGVEVKDGHLAS